MGRTAVLSGLAGGVALIEKGVDMATKALDPKRVRLLEGEDDLKAVSGQLDRIERSLKVYHDAARAFRERS